MNILFLHKPLNTIHPKKDTSLLLMQAAQKQGHSLYYLPQNHCSLSPTGATFTCTPITCTFDPKSPLTTGPEITLTEADVSAIFIRTDPPFDDRYLHDMWILDQLPPTITCINSPSGIRTVNEKIWATQFKDLIPKTWVTRSIPELNSILNEETNLILKPTNGFGGQHIFKLNKHDPNKHVILETLTQNQTQYIIAQPFLDAAKEGDKRILLCKGNAIGAILRKNTSDDHRNNFFAGGSAFPATITPNDQKIITTLAPHLQSLGLNFVGIDIIGDYLIEVNVTSPTCLQELNHLSDSEHEHALITELLA